MAWPLARDGSSCTDRGRDDGDKGALGARDGRPVAARSAGGVALERVMGTRVRACQVRWDGAAFAKASEGAKAEKEGGADSGNGGKTEKMACDGGWAEEARAEKASGSCGAPPATVAARPRGMMVQPVRVAVVRLRQPAVVCSTPPVAVGDCLNGRYRVATWNAGGLTVEKLFKLVEKIVRLRIEVVTVTETGSPAGQWKGHFQP